MNRFAKHIPSYVDCREMPAPTEFGTTEELLALPDVVYHTTLPKFSRFALSERYLMAIYDDGFKWWVVGGIAQPADVELPQWDGGKYRALMPDGSEAILTREHVRSSCGDELTLMDGSKAKMIREKAAGLEG